MEPEPGQLQTVPPQQPPPPPRPTVVEHPSTPQAQAQRAVGASAMLETSEDITLLLEALVAATLAYGPVEFDRMANIQGKENKPGYSYEWSSLREINKATRQPLANQGLIIMHGARPNSASALTVRTVLWHKSGQWVRNDLPVGLFGSDPREVGKAITYAKRYNVMALLNLSPGEDEDDDGAGSEPTLDAGPRRTAPVPAQRKSQQPEGRPASPPPMVAAPPSTTVAVGGDTAMSNIGVITALEERGGAWFCALGTGYKCATKDLELVESLKKFQKDGTRIELGCRKPKPGFAPTLEQILVAQS